MVNKNPVLIFSLIFSLFIISFGIVNAVEVNLVSPANNTFNSSAVFVCNVTDDFQVSNLSLYIWNLTRDLVNLNTTNLTGTINSTSWSITLPLDGNYTWNCLGVDNESNFNWSNQGNYSFVYDTTSPLIDFGERTENDSSSFSRNWTYVNISVTELYEANITFYLFNTTSLVNTTIHGAGNRTINWTNLADGLYYYNVTIMDRALNYNRTSTRNITLDTTAPVFSNLINQTSIVNQSFSYDLDATDLIGISMFWLNDSSVFNISSTTGLITNITNLSTPTLYYLNASVNDSFGFRRSMDFWVNVTLDYSSPVVSLVSPDNSYLTTSTTSSFVFKVWDNSSTNCSLIIDGSVVNFNSSVNIDGTNTPFSNSISIAYHNWSVNCTDIFGNMGNSSTRIIIRNSTSANDSDEEDVDSSSATFAPVTFWTSTFSVSKTQFESGYSKLLGARERLNFKIGIENHYVGIISLLSNLATINVSSKPQQAIFNVGDEKKFDVTGDNYYDISVKLNFIRSSKANITIKNISELMEVTILQNNLTTATNSNASNQISNLSQEIEKTSPKASEGWFGRYWLWIFILFIVILMFVVTVVIVLYILNKTSFSVEVKDFKSTKGGKPAKSKDLKVKEKEDGFLKKFKDKIFGIFGKSTKPKDSENKGK